MLKAIKHKERILEEFYLSDELTIRRKKDGYHQRFMKDDIVEPYTYKGNKGNDYKGVHIPRTRDTISLPWLYTVLRGKTIKEGQVIDHIDGDITNNSEDNLRLVSQELNCKNRSKRKDNTTGYTGITFNKSANLYVIRRTIKGKRIYRSSKTLEEAVDKLKLLNLEALIDGYTNRHGK